MENGEQTSLRESVVKRERKILLLLLLLLFGYMTQIASFGSVSAPKQFLSFQLNLF